MEVLFLHPAPGLDGKWVRVSPAVGEAGGDRGAVKCPHGTSLAPETFRSSSGWPPPVGPRPGADELACACAEKKSCPPSSSSSPFSRFPVPSSPPRAGRGGRRVPPPAGLPPHLAGAGQHCRYGDAGRGGTAAAASPPRRGLVFPPGAAGARGGCGRDGPGGAAQCSRSCPRSPAVN